MPLYHIFSEYGRYTEKEKKKVIRLGVKKNRHSTKVGKKENKVLAPLNGCSSRFGEIGGSDREHSPLRGKAGPYRQG
jgi:hypothetical protein